MSASQNGAVWWQKWAPVIAAVVVSGGAIIAFFTQVGNMQISLQSVQSSDAQRDRLIGELEAQVQRLREHQADDCQQMAKVETQFGTVETIINELRVDDLRTRGIIWPKIFQQPYPSPFYEIKVPHEVQGCGL